MDSIINIGLLKNPLNWLTVLMMVILAYIGAEIVFIQFSKK